MTTFNASQNITDVADEIRDKAIQRTTDVLRKINEVRRSLEMPVEQLPIVIDIYNKVVTALIAEKQREDLAARTSRRPLTLRSETTDLKPLKVKPGKSVDGDYFRVTTRPQTSSFRPEDIAIHGDRSRWLVHDIKVGNRTQFAQWRGPVAGTEFGPGGILEHLRLETARTAMDIDIVVEYVGPEAEGEVFEATVVGTAVDF